MRGFSFILLGAVLACEPKSATPATSPLVATSASPTTSLPVAPVVDNEASTLAYRDLIARIATSYDWLGRADGIFWAPFNCLAAPPAPAFRSAASDGEHARKVYRLFLQDPLTYAGATQSKLATPIYKGFTGQIPPYERERNPGDAASWSGAKDAPWAAFRETEQTLVKEAWLPTVCKDGNRGQKVGTDEYCLEKRGALFVMARPRKPAGLTDEGWIYGTWTDGTVTSAGRVASCMGCHVKAPHGRLFGLPSSAQ